MRLVPDIEMARKMKRPFPTLGELHVLDHIAKTLADVEDVTIFFQPKVGSLRPDIVVLREGHGCSIIEVKDWSLDSYNLKRNDKQEDGTEWYTRSTGVKILSPHLQVVSYKRRLFSEAGLDLIKIFNRPLYGVIKTVVVLTNTANTDAQSASHKYVPVLGRDGLPDTSAELLQVLGLGYKTETFSRECFNAIQRVLDPPTRPEQPFITVKLSERQRAALELPKSRRRKIHGAAGSGKTIVGVTLAAEAAQKGMQVMYLVYNNAAKQGVWNVLRSYNLDFPRSSVTVETIFKLAAPFNKLNEEQFLLSSQFFMAAQEKITESLRERTSVPDYERYDVIIIDEAQDHEYEWMQVLERDYLTDNGTLLIMADEAQNIYGKKLEEQRVKTPITGSWYRLNEHKRSDPAISELCDQFRRTYLSDTEANERQTEMGMGILEVQISQDHSKVGLTKKLLANDNLNEALTGRTQQRSSLIIARTSDIIRTVTDECRKLCPDRGKLSSMMETDLQRAVVFLGELKTTVDRYGADSRCANVRLTSDELEWIKKVFFRIPQDKLRERYVEIAKQLLYSENKGAARQEHLDVLSQLFERTRSVADRRIDEHEAVLSESQESYKNDIVHNYSFMIARLRAELKEDVFRNSSPIVVSTAHSSKGIERDRVYLLIDAYWHLNPQAHELLYTALTRARSELYVICSPKSTYSEFFGGYLKQ